MTWNIIAFSFLFFSWAAATSRCTDTVQCLYILFSPKAFFASLSSRLRYYKLISCVCLSCLPAQTQVISVRLVIHRLNWIVVSYSTADMQKFMCVFGASGNKIPHSLLPVVRTWWTWGRRFDEMSAATTAAVSSAEEEWGRWTDGLEVLHMPHIPHTCDYWTSKCVMPSYRTSVTGAQRTYLCGHKYYTFVSGFKGFFLAPHFLSCIWPFPFTGERMKGKCPQRESDQEFLPAILTHTHTEPAAFKSFYRTMT